MTNALQDTAAQLQLVRFALVDEAFGIDILEVQEVIRRVAVTPVPNSPACVDGILNLRGKIIPVINLRRRFGLPPLADPSRARIIVVALPQRTAGFVVDRVEAVARCAPEAIGGAPDQSTRVPARYIAGQAHLAAGPVLLLDLEQVLTVTNQDAPDSQRRSRGV